MPLPPSKKASNELRNSAAVYHAVWPRRASHYRALAGNDDAYDILKLSQALADATAEIDSYIGKVNVIISESIPLC